MDKAVVDSLIEHFPVNKSEMIEISVENNKPKFRKEIEKMKSYQLKNSGHPDLVTNEMIENTPVKVLTRMLKFHQKDPSSYQPKKGRKKAPAVYNIEDDMEFVEAYSDMIPKVFSKYLSPEQRRSIVFKAQVRKKWRKKFFDEKQYGHVSQWIPKEVAEILTKVS